PNGTGVPAFLNAVQNGISGLKFIPEFEELKFNCHVSGEPDFHWDDLRQYIPDVTLYGLRSISIGYAIKVAMDAWTDAGFETNQDEVQWDTGCVFGNSIADSVLMKNVISSVEAKESRKLGSRIVEQLMNSGPAAYISGRLCLGNQIITNSAACATGSQSVLLGYEAIVGGRANRMLVGSTEHIDPYIFAAFDTMRILPRKYNQEPQKASRPMSASACGFVPGSGAAALVLEELEYAQKRGARIYAEILGGANNSGGQRCGGSMTSPNPHGVVRCIEQALKDAQISPEKIDLISGHLTATKGDKIEVQNWAKVLKRRRDNFPFINSVKGMIGHCLSAAGSIEIIAVILQITHNFIHPNVNLEDPDPEIVEYTGETSMPVKKVNREMNIVVKANFGFGDVNTCLIFSKYK
ncbi:MAG: beta-ketoacyl-[acyl-carrier-protein] synthase family protein, partial [Chitinophagaceae bacterium]